jgi:hypothetical protein
MSTAAESILPPVEQVDWVDGDILGMPFPAHPDALREGGADFLTTAFHATGALPPENRVVAIDRLDAWHGGATGTKAALTVRYAAPTDLPTELFVKFSRAFDDPIRDRMRFEMEAEVRFAAVSRTPGFPITVPLCLLADFDAPSGTGILVTERVPYGEGDLEPHYPKCMDYDLPNAVGHYRALVDATATIAGSHRAGKLPAAITERFGFDREAAIAGNPMPRADQVQRRLERLAESTRTYPQLWLPELRDAAFLARFAEEATLFVEQAEPIARFLHAQPDFIALCHWNANIDNAWFWHDPAAEDGIGCGLMDWGGVGQMSIAMSLWGCLSGGEPEMWRAHLDDLIARFAQRYHASGGPALDLDELRLHYRLYVGMMGLAYLLDTPAGLTRLGIDLDAVTSREDPRLAVNETARTRLTMFTNVLDLWRRSDMAGAIAMAVSARAP